MSEELKEVMVRLESLEKKFDTVTRQTAVSKLSSKDIAA